MHQTPFNPDPAGDALTESVRHLFDDAAKTILPPVLEELSHTMAPKVQKMGLDERNIYIKNVFSIANRQNDYAFDGSTSVAFYNTVMESAGNFPLTEAVKPKTKFPITIMFDSEDNHAIDALGKKTIPKFDAQWDSEQGTGFVYVAGDIVAYHDVLKFLKKNKAKVTKDEKSIIKTIFIYTEFKDSGNDFSNAELQDDLTDKFNVDYKSSGGTAKGRRSITIKNFKSTKDLFKVFEWLDEKRHVPIIHIDNEKG